MKIIGSSSLFLPILTILLFSGGLFISDASAYLDPGTGSVVLQALIGALVGTGIAVKIYWVKLKYKFSSVFSKGNNDET